jgi:predicted O-methyltransferase YrrM
MKEILEYVNSPLNSGSIAQYYGTESFCYFLYSWVKMRRPRVLVELGTGFAVTTCFIAQALKENGDGRLWSVDDGRDWNEIRGKLSKDLKKPSYSQFTRALYSKLLISRQIKQIHRTLDEFGFYDPGKPIDLLFSDATRSDAEGCIALLKYYLPRMSEESSIFIDRASTINHSYHVLNYVVDQLNRGVIPHSLSAGLPKKSLARLKRLVETSRFSIRHLAENSQNKRNLLQNSRAWIEISREDYLLHNHVMNVFQP